MHRLVGVDVNPAVFSPELQPHDIVVVACDRPSGPFLAFAHVNITYVRHDCSEPGGHDLEINVMMSADKYSQMGTTFPETGSAPGDEWQLYCLKKA